jgi:TAG lipase/steryl ester hydrolase/phospholipase A2/LPA acyltransferase
MAFLHDSLGLPVSLAAGPAGQDAPWTAASSTRLIKSLRDPYKLIGARRLDSAHRRAKSDTSPQLDDSEWRRQVLQLKVSQAKCYTDWLSAASELDSLEGRDAWKDDEESDEYDTALVKARTQELEDARISCDAKRMLFLARTSLTRDLGAMGHVRLYKHCRVGTKALIERYILAALHMLETIVDMCSPLSRKDAHLDIGHVYEQLLSARQAFGRSALLLSGGGTLGMNHIGVLKTLFEAQLLPRIISGASAGSIVAAVLCTKTDDEIPQVLREFCYGDLDVFEKEGEPESVLKKVFRFCTKGALFDISNLVRVMKDLLGDMTFQEAYNRTRRILNIGVSTASLYELPRLLNYITAPNVMIWSAVATSCSVPFVFSPAQLLAKDPRTGLEVPWDQSPQRWIDGSVDNDLPMSRLAEMFNVNHFIVSQVNPHVVPFLEKDDQLSDAETKPSSFALVPTPSWLRTVANLAKGEALHRMQVLAELNILPTTISKVRSVLSQRYSGDITILPEVNYAQFPRVLKNPTTSFMYEAMLSGETATWPKLSQVRNHCAIELALDLAVQKVRYGLVFSPSQIDLRLNAFAYSAAGEEKETIQYARRASHGNNGVSVDREGARLLLSLPSTSALRKPRLSPTIPLLGRQSHTFFSSAAPAATATAKHATSHSDHQEDFYSGQETAVDSSSSSPGADDEDQAQWSEDSDPYLPSSSSHHQHQPSYPSKSWARQPLRNVSRSQPATPNLGSRFLYSTTPVLAPSEDSSRYRSVFSNARPGGSLSAATTTATIDAGGGVDAAGMKGGEDGVVVHRRKRSFTTGFRGLWPPA